MPKLCTWAETARFRFVARSCGHQIRQQDFYYAPFRDASYNDRHSAPRRSFVSIPPKPRILVADDQCLVADMLVMILQQHGYETTAAYGGRLAVEKARQWRPGLFLS